MTLYEFNTSDELEQLKAIWKYGAVVAEREDEVHRYKLYQIHSFYVEEVWHTEYDVRWAFKSFASTNAQAMKKYLNEIDFKGIG